MNTDTSIKSVKRQMKAIQAQLAKRDAEIAALHAGKAARDAYDALCERYEAAQHEASEAAERGEGTGSVASGWALAFDAARRDVVRAWEVITRFYPAMAECMPDLTFGPTFDPKSLN